MSSALINCLREISKTPSSTNSTVEEQTSAAIEKWKNTKYTKKHEMQVRAEKDFSFDIVTNKKIRISNVYVIENAIQPAKEINLPIVNMRVRNMKNPQSSSVQKEIIRSRCAMATFLSRQSTPLPSSDQTHFFAQYIDDSTIKSINNDALKTRKRLKAYVSTQKSLTTKNIQ